MLLKILLCKLPAPFRVFALVIGAVLASGSSVYGMQKVSEYVQSHAENETIATAKAGLSNLRNLGSISVVRMLIDKGLQDTVSSFVLELEANQRTKFLRELLYEGGFHGSVKTLEYVLTKLPQDRRTSATLECIKSLAHGRHYSAATKFSVEHLMPDKREEASFEIATYAFRFGQIEIAKNLVRDPIRWNELEVEFEPSRVRVVRSQEFDRTLGIDWLWSDLLFAYRSQKNEEFTSDLELQNYVET